jgi:hypothetical protein
MIETVVEGDVVRVAVSGRVAEGDIAPIVDRLEAELAHRPQTHFLVEVDGFAGLDAAACTAELRRAMRLLGRLDRFGRIAIVSGQRWIRWASRIESALLPGIGYEIFEPAERDRALAWVRGERRVPHAGSIAIIPTSRPDVIGFEVDGTLRTPELEATVAFFAEALRAERPVSLLARLKHIGGAELATFAWPEFIKLKLQALRHVKRYALVGGPPWVRAWADALDGLFEANIRHFAEGDEPAVWAWLGAEPRGLRPLVD